MEAAGAAFRGSGGGHEFVGGARGLPERAVAALEECLSRVKMVLGVGETAGKRVSLG
jgi:hypothetical protein